MTEKELWEVYCTKYPSFREDGVITMKRDGLRRLVQVTFENGVSEGREMGRREEMAANSLFNKLFGR